MKSAKRLISVLFALALIVSVFCGCAKTEDTSQLSENALERNEYVAFLETEDDADCSLIHIGEHNILIDTGTDDDAEDILEYLNAKNINSLEYMVLSHFDKDHCGGATEILNSIQVDKVVHPKYVEESKASTEFLDAVKNKGVTETVIDEVTEYRFDTISLTFYPSDYEYENKTSNNSSLVVKLTYLEKSVLFTGDIETDRVSDLVNDTDVEYLNADVLKVPYHGREIENEKAFIDAVSPSYSVVTGKGKKVKNNIESLGDSLGEVYYSQDGTVTFYFNFNGDFEITVMK